MRVWRPKHSHRSHTGCVAWLAKTLISGNPTGVTVFGTLNSHGDNYINDNFAAVNPVGSFTPVSAQ
jgi:hypothetical protein